MDREALFSVCDTNFEQKALEVFCFQYENNKVYKQFCNLLDRNPQKITSLQEIPFLPIEFFKERPIFCGNTQPQHFFTSSGTTQMIPSKHFVKDIPLYEESFQRGFELFYGKPQDYTILALLPSYLKRSGSSLIYMVNDLIAHTQNAQSGFYLYNIDELALKINQLDAYGHKILLIGVSYALLDLVEKYSFSLQNTIVMETGGMKGKRKELIREELHHILCQKMGVQAIHSEYGMTEMLSQAYSQGGGIFKPVPWLKVLVRDPEDAFSFNACGKTGGINIIDLANIHSCSFIATQDLGRIFSDGTFEILGRFDNADIRGCNLLTVN
ncbi:acyl transferase [Capnocytophaga catalasegens]|uniref:Acyltransferase n=1 Tax=Capnocytophaga catalasegens TaxID=1004260 RepID=A0AAV5B0L6_9FLAO|nr:acyl transferase [Capnocytophaga catalasegens]GIZ14396.1 acyltransferase [Capnocytophaga catalasegens]GJM51516.1 acyltransferase [Capnocytophaga catalasegens]GJM53420.1 acyltransferase [Capnocytophaga catalasegens]